MNANHLSWLQGLSESLSTSVYYRIAVRLPGADRDLEIGSGEELLTRVIVRSEEFLRRLIASDEDISLLFGEALAAGEVAIQGSFEALGRAFYDIDKTGRWRTTVLQRPQHQKEKDARSRRRDVAWSYDVPNEFVTALLDEGTRSFSMGVFEAPVGSIDNVYLSALRSAKTDEEYEASVLSDLRRASQHDAQMLQGAQRRKVKLLADKLLCGITHVPRGELRVLDLGCGWGGFAEHLASLGDIQVDAITASKRQFDFVRSRVATLGSSVSVELADFRLFQTDKRYDGIACIAMLEHVGEHGLEALIGFVKQHLRVGGVAVIHCIVQREHWLLNPFLDKWIFPGAYVPPLSRLVEVIEQAELDVVNLELFRESYDHTLQLWEANLIRNRQMLLPGLQAYYSELMKADLSEDYVYGIWLHFLRSTRLAFAMGRYRVGHLVIAHASDRGCRDSIAARVHSNT